MSSAPVSAMSRAVDAVRGLFWAMLLVLLAVSGAGLTDQLWNPPGTSARAELTYAGDTALGARLDDAVGRLRQVDADVARLSDEAKLALAQVSAADAGALQGTLQRGADVAAAIERELDDLDASLADLPGDEADAMLRYGNAQLVRRSAVLAAIPSARGLADAWATVELRAGEIAQLTGLIAEHDKTVLAAAALGRGGKYAEAMTEVANARLVLADIGTLRARLIASTEVTVLDEWLARNLRYDTALTALYAALVKSGGVKTLEVQAAYHEEGVARAQLPPDNRTIVLIVAEASRAGLNAAVLAIEEAYARIDQAVAETGEQPTDEPDSGNPLTDGSPSP